MGAFLKAVGATGLTNADGTPTPEAALRVQRALMTAIFGNDEKIRAIVQNLLERSGELSLGTLQNALMRSAGKLLAMKRAKGSFDIVNDVREAAYHYIAWRSAQQKQKSLSFADYLSEQDMFADVATPMQAALAKLLEVGRFGTVLDEYSKLVAQEAVDAQGSFDFAEKRTPLQLLGYAERNTLAAEETPVTPDPTSAEAAEPVQTPPAVSEKESGVRSQGSGVDTNPSVLTPNPLLTTAQAVITPPEPETFTPAPLVRGTATLPGPGAEGIKAHQVNANGEPTTRVKTLPAGAWNLLRAPYDVRRPPKASAQDKAGRGLKISNPPPVDWNGIFPHFQGNKTEMADRTSQAIRANMTKAEREHYTTVVDYFGGGGCWGLFHALANFPNAKTLVINEFDPDRLGKIRLLQEIDGELADIAYKLLDERYEEIREAAKDSSSPSTIANVVESQFKRLYTDPTERAAIQAFIDCAHTLLATSKDAQGNAINDTRLGIRRAIDTLRDDGRKAKEAADAFKAREGATIRYVSGDAVANADTLPHGDDVMAIAAPPYYLTSDYQQNTILGLEKVSDNWSYRATQDFLHYLVDNGDAIVYTDEAWWFKESYTPDMQTDFFSGGLSNFDKEQEILLDIINTLDHFDVAGRVVGRQEVLGVHHGHKVNARTENGENGNAVQPDAIDNAGGGRGAGSPVLGVAAEPQGQSGRDGTAGGERGLNGERASVIASGRRALAREVIIQDIAASLESAATEIAQGAAVDTDAISRLARYSVRQVREERMADYAQFVSTNAKAWLKHAAKRLDERMKEAGYTEKVWHGTEGEDFNVFKFSAGSHEVPAAYFSYKQSTAENYAAWRSMNAFDTLAESGVENAESAVKPNIRGFYINPGKVLDIDETKKAIPFDEFKKILADAYNDGYNTVRVKGAFDDQGFRLGDNDDFTGFHIIDTENEDGGRTDILIVMQQPDDNAQARIKAADTVTFDDDGLPIPLEMRVDQSMSDIRFSVQMGKKAREEARRMIEKYRPGLHGFLTNVNGVLMPQDDAAIESIAAFETPKERKAALLWFCKYAIRLPEDAPKVTEAIKTAERAKVDPMQYERPGDILEEFSEFRPKEPPINPDTVPELSDKRDMGNGVTTYLVQDDKAGQLAMRKIINTHWGKDANPWCLLQGDGYGNLSDGSNGGYDAWHYWQHYNALPKRVAFQDGKLLAFMATDGHSGGIMADEDVKEQWWDRADQSHEGIPIKRETKSETEYGASTTTETIELMQDGTEVPTGKKRESIAPDGTRTEEIWGDGGNADRYDCNIHYPSGVREEKTIGRNITKTTFSTVTDNLLDATSMQYANSLVEEITWRHDNYTDYKLRTKNNGYVLYKYERGAFRETDVEYTSETVNVWLASAEAALRRGEAMPPLPGAESASTTPRWSVGSQRFSVAHDEWVSLAGTERLAEGWTFVPNGLTQKEIEALSAVIPEKHHVGSEPRGDDVILQAMFPPNWEKSLYPRFVKQFNGDEKALERVCKALYLVYGWHNVSPRYFYLTHNEEVLDALNAPSVPEIDRVKEKERLDSLFEKEKDAWSRKQALQKKIGYPAYKENAEWAKAKDEYELYRKERLSPSPDAIKRQEIIKERNRLWEENKQQFFEKYRDERQSKGWKELDAIAKEYGVKTLSQLNGDIRFSVGGVYTGSAADYEKPSLHYVGTGGAGGKPIRHSVRSVGDYYDTAELRELAHAIKNGESAAIERAADLMAPSVPEKAVLVPMPSHEGRATTMLTLANAIAKKANGATVVDAIEAEPHESNYEHKKRTGKSTQITMHRVKGARLPKSRPIIIVDNVIASGTTYAAADKILPNADLVVLASDARHSIRISRKEYAILASKVTENDAKAYKAGIEPLPWGVANTGSYGYLYDRFSDATFAVRKRWLFSAKNAIIYNEYKKDFENEFNEAAAIARADYEALRNIGRGDLRDDPNWIRDRTAAMDDAGLSELQIRPEGRIPQGAGSDLDSRGDSKGLPDPRGSRSSVKKMRPGRLSDLARAFVAQQHLAGKEASVQDVDKILRNLGLTLNAPEFLTSAKELAERNKANAKQLVRTNAKDLVSFLEASNMADRLDEALKQSISTGARLNDPETGAIIERTIQSKKIRDLQNAHGITAAEILAELPIDLGQCVMAVAELERTPEELAKLEEMRKKREEERKKKLETQEGAEEAANEDAPLPIVDEKGEALIASYMDRAKFAKEAQQAEDARAKAEREKKQKQAAANTEESNEDGEDGGGDAGTDLLPEPTVKRIAPLFQDSALFAHFIIELSADKTREKHPTLPSTGDIWKNPIAIRELKQTAANILRQIAKDTLGSSGLSRERNLVDRAINELESDLEVRTYNAVRRHIADIYEQIHDHAHRKTKRELIKDLLRDINKLTQKGRFSYTQEELDRKIPAKVEQWARWIIKYVRMGEEKLTEEIIRLRAIVEKTPLDENAKPPTPIELAEAADKLIVAQQFGNLRRFTAGEIRDKAEFIRQQLDGGRQALELKRAQMEEKCTTIRDAIAKAITAGGINKRKRSQKRGLVSKMAESMIGDIRQQMHDLIRFCQDGTLRKEALAAIDELTILINEGGTNYANTLADAQTELNDGLKLCYGNAIKGIKHLNEALPDEIVAKFFTQAHDQTPTYGQLLQLYASCLQRDYAENIKTHGRDAQIEEMEKALADEDKKFHTWAIEWYKANRASLSDAVEAVTGLPVVSPDEMYVPVRVMNETTGIPADVVAWSPVPSQLNRRVKHGLDFDEQANILSILQQQCEIRAQTIGYSMAGIILRDTIAHRDVQMAAKKHLSPDEMRGVLDHTRDILAQKAGREAAYWESLNIARKWIARFGISGNLSSALAQPASIPVWANVILDGNAWGVANVLKAMASAGTNEGRAAIAELRASDGYKARYEQGWSEEVANCIANPEQTRVLRAIGALYDKGMKLSAFTDAMCSLWIAQGFYRHAKDVFLRKGDTEADAKRKALALTWASVESTQQSGRTENQAAAQRGKGRAIAGAIFQFKTAMLLSNSYLFRAIRDVRAGTPGAIGRLMRAIFINAVWVPGYLTAKNALWSLFMGNAPEPEDEDKMPLWFREMLYSAAKGTRGVCPQRECQMAEGVFRQDLQD